MENSSSPLETLRQLKEMLDAGTITPAEFEKLKQQLVFSKTEAATPPVVPVLPLVTPIVPSSVPPEDLIELNNPTEFASVPASAPINTPTAANAPGNNPLNLVLIIGGALAVLALVLYLALGNRTSDEHLTSTTQTAADTTSTVEVGPQEEQITLPPAAAPETIRVAPTHPVAPIVRPQPAKTDSVSTPTPAPAPTAKSDSI